MEKKKISRRESNTLFPDGRVLYLLPMGTPDGGILILLLAPAEVTDASVENVENEEYIRTWLRRHLG